MKNRIFKTLFVIIATLTMFTTSLMETQDEGAAFGREVQSLIESGVSKEEIISYLRANGLINDIVGSTQSLKDARETGYFENKKSETAPTTVTPKPKATPTPKHEHKYSNKLTKKPTCTEDGVLTYTCECGDTYEEPVKKLEHNYVETVTKEPTCTTDGEKTIKCSLCGDSHTEVIKAIGHTEGQFLITKQPTCTEQGEKTIYCSVCSEPVRTEVIESTGHENTYTKTTPPGFFTTGKEEVICMKCFEVLETKEIPVPMWQYFLVGGIGVVILLIVITLIVKKDKKR